MSENQATFTISIAGSGVETANVPSDNTVRAILESRGVDLNTPVMVNGVPATLDSVVEQDTVLTASKPGKGA